VLGPDDGFSNHEVLNHLYDVSHVSSSTLGDRKDGTTNLARYELVERWDTSALSASSTSL
jgi:hypothetical protein